MLRLGMAAPICIDVIDRPRGGAARALVSLGRMAKRGAPSGCDGLVPCTTTHFSATVVPKPSPRRIAIVSAWADPDLLDRQATVGPLADLAHGAREHWRVRCELVRVNVAPDAWRKWVPAAGEVAPLEDDEPLLVLISGELRAGALPAFVRYGARAYAHASKHPGYLGGLAMFSSVLNTTSCSAWRSSTDSREYAFRPGGHADALRNDREGGNHHSQRFLRLRPLTSAGSLGGRDPFSGLIPHRR